jgi:DNA-directed RNA polymerase subunit A"
MVLTGYLQRKLMKSLEDIKIGYGNYVQNANGQIIQFLYGGDVMDACFLEKQSLQLCTLDNQQIQKEYIFLPNEIEKYLIKSYYPKVQNYQDKTIQKLMLIRSELHKNNFQDTVHVPFNIDRIINNNRDEEKSNKKIHMSYTFIIDELEKLLNSLHVNKILSCIKDIYINNIRNVLYSKLSPKQVIVTYRLSKKQFTDILSIIREKYLRSIVQPGEMVGAITAQSIGESLTQLSVVKDTKVIIKENGNTKIVEIGEFIDKMMNNYSSSVIETHITENGIKSSILPINEKFQLFVPGLDQNEKVVWGQLTELSRHPMNGGLVKITTRSGRDITCTLSHSFLTRKNNCVVPIKGSDLKVGTIVPIIGNLIVDENNFINLTEYIDESRFIIENELIYSSRIAHGRSTKDIIGIPTKLPLDYTFGCFIGQVLSDCHISKDNNNIEMMNTEYSYIQNTKNFCDQYSIKYSEKIDENNRGFKSDKVCYKLTIYSRLFNDLAKTWCGNGFMDKHIPDWSINAPREFLSGLLSMYFDGDRNVFVDSNHKTIRAHSSSKELLYGIGLLLTRFNIKTIIKISRVQNGKTLYEINIFSKYAKHYQECIGFGIQYKSDTLDKLVSFMESTTRTDRIDRISNMGSVLADASLKSETRHYLNGPIKSDSIGRESLKKYINIMEQKAITLGVDLSLELNVLKQGVNSDVLWDTIVSLDYIQESNDYVYDFSVQNIESFSASNGLIVHNTLNSFHSAGISSKTQITSGIPRFRELINVSKSPFNPSVEIHLNERYRKNEDHVAVLLEQLEYTELKYFLEKINIYYDPNVKQTSTGNQTIYDCNNKWFKSEIGESPWVLVISLNDSKVYKKKIFMTQFYEALKSVAYNKDLTIICSDDNDDTLEIHIRCNTHDETNNKVLYALAIELPRLYICGLENIRENHVCESKINVLDDSGKIIAEKEYIINTIGGHLEDIIILPFVDPYKTISTHIYDTFNTLGMEATRELLYREIQKLLASNGIYINSRHIELLVDVITHRVFLMSMDRHGVKKANIGPLSRASFEESIEQLSKAAIFSQLDELEGVTPNVMIGQIGNFGTGMSEVVIDTAVLKINN